MGEGLSGERSRMAFQDIRKSRRWLSREEVVFLFLLLVLLGLLIAANIALARVLPGGELFFLRWSGARAFLIEQIEPYSRTIAERVQEVAYGRQAFSSEYPYVLNDPFYIVLLYTPLALIPDFSVARGMWMLFSEVALIGILYLAVQLAEWTPPRWLFIALMGLGLFSYFAFQSLLSASPAIILTFLYLSILFALRSFSDELAGALLFLTAYQWEAGGMFFLFMFLFIFANRRWRALAGFGMALVVLLFVSFLVYPGWTLPYLRGVLSDWYRSSNLTFGSILSFWFESIISSMSGWIYVVPGIVLLLEWIGSFNAHFRRVFWTASLSLALNPFMGFAIFPSNYVTLIPAFVLVIALVWERWTRHRLWLTAILAAILFLFPYVLPFLRTGSNLRLISDLTSVLPPTVAIVGLYWMRWWATRSPRTWFDQIGGRA